jgi:hypothetical protein
MNKEIDLESAIMKAWQIVDDLDTFYRYHGDAKKPMTEDEVANTLLGLKQIQEMRMWELMDTYSRKFELDQYCTDPEKLAARDKLFGDVHKFSVESRGNAFTKKFKKAYKK